MARAKLPDSITIHVTSAKIARPPRACRTLADDMAVLPLNRFGNIDPDLEMFTWPDMIDQTHIGDPAVAFCGAFADDDMELDDGV